MVDPVSDKRATSVGSIRPAAPARSADGTASSGEFAALLRKQLDRVSQMQNEADAGVQNLLTGQTQNITEVLAAARKAEVAFSLLMEIRNKLVDAYTELKRMPV